MHSSRPQLELDLSGDRAAALIEECIARDAEVMASLNAFIEEDEARINALLQDIIKSDEAAIESLREYILNDDAGRPPAIQEPASRRP